MPTAIKTYKEFLQETDVVGHEEAQATKPTALSEKALAKINEMMDECMSEATAYHEDEDPDHTAEGWAAECNNYINECMEKFVRECNNMTNLVGDGMNKSDGNMRQGSIQDVPAMGGAVR
jgi:hypothetical protein